MGRDAGHPTKQGSLDEGPVSSRTAAQSLRGRVASLLRANRILWSVIVLAGGTALGQLVVVVSSPLLTRIYSPQDFGILVVYVSLLSFLLGIATWRYQMAIPLAKNDLDVASLLTLCMLVLLAMTLLLTTIVMVFGGHIVDWVNAPRLKSFLWLLPVSFAGAGAFQVLMSWAIRNDEFGVLGRTRLLQSTGQVGSQIVLGLLSVGAIGLLLGDAFGRVSGSLRLSQMAWRQLRAEFRQVNVQRIGQIAHRYRRFPLISSGSGFLASAGLQLPTLLIASFYGALVVGWFGLCQRLLSMSFSLVSSSIGSVFLSEAAKFASDDPEKLMRFYWATIKRSSGIALLLTSGVILIAPFLFRPVFGAQWEEAGRYAQVLAVAAGFQFVNRTVGSSAIVVERQDIDLMCEIIGTVCGSGVLVAGGVLHLDAFMCIALYAIGDSIGSFFGLGLSWYAISRSIRNWNQRVADNSEMEFQ